MEFVKPLLGIGVLIALGVSGYRRGAIEDPPSVPARTGGGSDAPSPAPLLRFKIDPSIGWMAAHVGTAGLLSGLGHAHTMAIREFQGEVGLTAGTVTPAFLRMTVRPSSVSETDPEFNADDRQKINEHARDQALESSKFEEISFQSTRILARPAREGAGNYPLDITGILELHGVRRQVTLSVSLMLQESELTAIGEFTILHSDFKMERLSAALETIGASDEIKISFEVRARRVGSVR